MTYRRKKQFCCTLIASAVVITFGLRFDTHRKKENPENQELKEKSDNYLEEQFSTKI